MSASSTHTPPVALVTGSSSGIGLALTQHLLSKSWAVVCLDINPPPPSTRSSTTQNATNGCNNDENTLFVPTDVSSWPALSSAFAKAFSWHNRLNAVFLNAGIDDRDDIFSSLSLSLSQPPSQPNLKTLDVNFTAVYHGIKLAAHYMSLNSPHRGGKIVVTASSAGLYALPPIPVYTASKYALVGLVRALGPRAREVGVSINAIAPAIVATGLAPEGLMDAFSEEVRTPMGTVLRAFEVLGGFGEGEEVVAVVAAEGLEEKKREAVGGVGTEGWGGRGWTGQIVECSLDKLYFREEVDKADDSQRFMSQGALDAWATAYTERNRRFALMNDGRLEH